MQNRIRAIILFLTLSIVINCQKPVIEKPEKLIDENTMVDIIYDLSILEAIKLQNAVSPDSIAINPNEFILKKYKVDSIQFAKNDKYYASDIKKYKKIYDKVAERIQKKMGVTDLPK